MDRITAASNDFAINLVSFKTLDYPMVLSLLKGRKH
jgi:hypothetical protein